MITHEVCKSHAIYTPGLEYVPAVYEKVSEFVGATLEIRSHTYQVMSDVWETGYYAIVWNDEEEKSQRIDWVDYSNSVVDATDEVKAFYRAELVAREFTRLKIDYEKMYAKISKGDKVKVIRGRQSVGIEGYVFAVFSRMYNAGYSSQFENKYGITIDGEYVMKTADSGREYKEYTNCVWVWARNCEKIDIPAINEDELWSEADDRVSRMEKNGWVY